MKITHKFLNILVICLMVLPLFGSAATNIQRTSRAQPVLVQLAHSQPAEIIQVIVQKTSSEVDLSAAIARLGGTITQDLGIIRAFSALIPAGAVLSLADHPGVRWISLDAMMKKAGAPTTGACMNNPFLDTLQVRDVWNMGLRGEAIRVAVVDSGIVSDADFSKVTMQKSFNPNSATVNDVFGHGSHVAGVIAGNGNDSSQMFMGIAPGVELISLKVSDETGQARESDVVAALQWVYDNRSTYNIRVVNLSLNSSLEQSYHTSPLDGAVEILWFSGIVVVASAGNSTSGYNTIRSAPANDPFIITVGATNEACTTSRTDDSMAAFSMAGITQDGFSKPEILAPGTDIISVLPSKSTFATSYPDRIVLNGQYFRASGTSMAAPMVAGAVALLLQDEPYLNPDQVKYRLLNTSPLLKVSRTLSVPYLNVYRAVTGNTTQSYNTGLAASQLLSSGTEPIAWNSISWNSISWNSISWNSISWNSISWNSISWNSIYLGK